MQRAWRVAEIIGNDGWNIPTENPDTFARGYNLCWTANFGKVWYDGPSGLSIRKDVINPNGRVVPSATSFGRVAPTIAFDVARDGKPGRWDDTCWGRRVTIRGSFTNDTLQGTDGPDVIFAYAGVDVVLGLGGNDRICGRWGPDLLLSGDAGFDRVNGGGDPDLCLAERTRYC